MLSRVVLRCLVLTVMSRGPVSVEGPSLDGGRQVVTGYAAFVVCSPTITKGGPAINCPLTSEVSGRLKRNDQWCSTNQSFYEEVADTHCRSSTATASGTVPAVTEANDLPVLKDRLLDRSISSQDALQKMSRFPFRPELVNVVLEILGIIIERSKRKKFSAEEVKNVISIASKLVSKSCINKTNGAQLLNHVENVFSNMRVTNQSFDMSSGRMEGRCLAFKCDEFNHGASIQLNSEASLRVSRPKKACGFPRTCLVNVLVMTSQLQSETFSSQYEDGKGEGYELAADILTIVMLFNDTTDHISFVNMSFECDTCDQAAICVFWDVQLSRWSSEGCLTQVTDGVTNCFCSHLTSFSVLMSRAGLPSNDTHSKILGYITKTGLITSIVCLFLCISSYVVLVNQTGTSMIAFFQHFAILNMSVFLLISHFSFFGLSYITPREHPKLCLVITFGLHWSLLGFFCWTLVKGAVLACRLVFIFYYITRRQYLVLSIVLGYLCPVAIAVVTLLWFYPHAYMQSEHCWLEYSSGAMMAFIVPTIIIMGGNFLVLLVVIRTFLRPPVSDEKRRDREVVRKVMKAVLFCTPQFGLTWAVGILLFIDEQNIILHYMFSLLNPLQGFFIFLVCCLLDVKVTTLFKKPGDKTMALKMTTNKSQ